MPDTAGSTAFFFSMKDESATEAGIFGIDDQAWHDIKAQKGVSTGLLPSALELIRAEILGIGGHLLRSCDSSFDAKHPSKAKQLVGPASGNYR